MGSALPGRQEDEALASLFSKLTAPGAGESPVLAKEDEARGPEPPRPTSCPGQPTIAHTPPRPDLLPRCVFGVADNK